MKGIKGLHQWLLHRLGKGPQHKPGGGAIAAIVFPGWAGRERRPFASTRQVATFRRREGGVAIVLILALIIFILGFFAILINLQGMQTAYYQLQTISERAGRTTLNTFQRQIVSPVAFPSTLPTQAQVSYRAQLAVEKLKANQTVISDWSVFGGAFDSFRLTNHMASITVYPGVGGSSLIPSRDSLYVSLGFYGSRYEMRLNAGDAAASVNPDNLTIFSAIPAANPVPEPRSDTLIRNQLNETQTGTVTSELRFWSDSAATSPVTVWIDCLETVPTIKNPISNSAINVFMTVSRTTIATGSTITSDPIDLSSASYSSPLPPGAVSSSVRASVLNYLCSSTSQSGSFVNGSRIVVGPPNQSIAWIFNRISFLNYVSNGNQLDWGLDMLIAGTVPLFSMSTAQPTRVIQSNWCLIGSWTTCQDFLPGVRR